MVRNIFLAVGKIGTTFGKSYAIITCRRVET